MLYRLVMKLTKFVELFAKKFWKKRLYKTRKSKLKFMQIKRNLYQVYRLLYARATHSPFVIPLWNSLIIHKENKTVNHDRKAVCIPDTESRFLLICLNLNFYFLILYKMYFQNYFAIRCIKLESLPPWLTPPPPPRNGLRSKPRRILYLLFQAVKEPTFSCNFDWLYYTLATLVRDNFTPTLQ